MMFSADSSKECGTSQKLNKEVDLSNYQDQADAYHQKRTVCMIKHDVTHCVMILADCPFDPTEDRGQAKFIVLTGITKLCQRRC